MKRILTTIKSFVISVLLLVVTLAGQDLSDNGSIEGIVANHSSGRPVEGVVVTVVSESGVKFSSTSNQTGKFVFEKVPPGNYVLAASRSGFLTYDNTDHNTAFSLSRRQQMKDLQILLEPISVITGTVFDANHVPIANTEVIAIRPIWVDGRQVLHSSEASLRFLLPMGSRFPTYRPEAKMKTDENGQYRISGLTPGKYYIAAWNPRADAASVTLPPVYYPGVEDPDAAIPVELNGFDLSGINLEVHSQAKHTFSFKIESPAVAPYDCSVMPELARNLKGFVIVRHTQNFDVVQDISPLEDIGPGGRRVYRYENDVWTSPPLPSGDYQIFHTPCSLGPFGSVGVLEVHIGDHDVYAGTLAVPLNVGTVGTVRYDYAPSATLETLQVRLRPLDLRAAYFGMTFSPGNRNGDFPDFPVKDDGTFTFNLEWSKDFPSVARVAPGRYQFEISGLPLDVYVASVKFGGQEVRDSGIVVDSDSSGSMSITLAQPGGIISGSVKNRDGKPAIDSFVALMPEDRKLTSSSLFRLIRTDRNGLFAIHGIPPGSYAVIAMNRLEAGEERSSEFWEEFGSRTSHVTTIPSSTKELELIENYR